MIYHRKNLGYAAWMAVKGIYVVSNAVRMILWFVLSAVDKRSPHTAQISRGEGSASIPFLGVEPE